MDKALAAPLVQDGPAPAIREREPLYRAPLKQAGWGVVIIGGLLIYVALSLFCGEE